MAKTVELGIERSEKTNDFYFTINDVPIQNKDNPKGEMLKAVMDMEPKPPKKQRLFLIYGLDFGYTIEAVRAVYPESVIFCYEPSIPIIEEVMERRQGDLMSLPELFITASLPALVQRIHDKFGTNEPAYIIPIEKWVDIFPKQYGEFVEKTSNVVLVKMMSNVTKKVRYKQWVENFFDNLPTYLKGPHPAKLFRSVSPNTPVVVCSAGPSLKKNIQLLKGIEDKVIIVAVTSAYDTLVKYGIRPHILVNIESIDCSSMLNHYDKIDSTLLAPLVVNKAMYDLPFENKILFSQYPSMYSYLTKDKLQDPVSLEIGGSVACAAFSIGYMLGAYTIIMLGQDLALEDKEETDYYADGNKYNEKKTIINKQAGKIVIPVKKEVFKQDPSFQKLERTPDYITLPLKYTKSWYDDGTMVPTHNHFIFFISWFESVGLALQNKRNLFNCTEGGVYLNGFYHKPLKETLEACKVNELPEHNIDEVLHSCKPLPTYEGAFKKELENMLETMNKEGVLIGDVEDEIPLFDSYTINTKEDPKEMVKHLKRFKDMVQKAYDALDYPEVS